MAKMKKDKKLYVQLRAGGVRKRVARELSRLPETDTATPTPTQRSAVDKLRDVTAELEIRIGTDRRPDDREPSEILEVADIHSVRVGP